MTYEEFKKQLLAEIRAIAGERKIWFSEYPDNRMAETLNAAIPESESVCQCPVAEAVWNYRNGKEIPQIARDILDRFDRQRQVLLRTSKQVKTLETASRYLRFRLINAHDPDIQNYATMHSSFLDMEVLLFLDLPTSDGTNRLTMNVSPKMAVDWGNKTFQELFAIALRNMQENEPMILETARETYEQMLKASGRTDPEDFARMNNHVLDQSNVYSLSTKTHMFGAACIVYPDTLKKVAEKFGENFYLLPEGTHGWTVMPESAWTDAMWLSVQLVQTMHSQDTELLTANVYYYNQKTDALSIARRTN